MNFIFFRDEEMSPLSVLFFGTRLCLFFWQKGNIIFVTFIHIYRKYHISLYFLIKINFHFPSKENILYFREKRNTIFPDITKKIIFKCDFFGNTIFSEHLRKASYLHVFSEKDHLSFCV